MIEKIEDYIQNVDITTLTLEQLEHYTKIIIMLENQKAEQLSRAIIIDNMMKNKN